MSGTIEQFAAHHADIERNRTAAIARNEALHAQPNGFHHASPEHEATEQAFLAGLAQRGVHVHSDEGRAAIAAFRTGTHPSQMKA